MPSGTEAAADEADGGVSRVGYRRGGLDLGDERSEGCFGDPSAPIQGCLSRAARRLGLWVIGGSLPLAPLAQFTAKWLNRKHYEMLPTTAEQFANFGAGQPEGKGTTAAAKTPSVGTVLTLILVPLLLIMLGTTGATMPGIKRAGRRLMY